jgi:hypothetical protein
MPFIRLMDHYRLNPGLARRMLFGGRQCDTTTMNLRNYEPPYPDLISIPSELSFTDRWDGEAVTELIRSKSTAGETPAFLFLGRREARMLKEHLAEIFGEETVVTQNGTY